MGKESAAYDLELVKLEKIFPNGTVAVDAFDLQVERGEFLSFVGPSGCGKTTTLRMIAGLEPVTSGHVLIRGEDVTETPTEQRPTSTIFQNYAIFPHMTVRENITFGLEVRKLEAAEVKKRTDDILEKLQLSDIADAKERSLSGGQKQRLALARGLVVEPEILLLDEPLGALDANLRKSIQEELKLLQRRLGITFVFVTHAQAEALSMADRVVVMNQGRVEQISEPFELYTRPRTPFVARFIGRNKILAGTIKGSDGDTATIDTRFGTLSGKKSYDDAGRTGPGMIVVPSEYVDVHALDGSGGTAGEAGVTGAIRSIDRVGQLMFLSVDLDDDTEVRIESHIDKLGDRGLAPATKILLSWSPDRATVVAGDMP
ncbi:MAG: ABC transporter ATP-binding protein [Alphaproteobacteria bacterium]|nr:ABC transporter ATP-binding protein [Alphaproteobacteria bacterium]